MQVIDRLVIDIDRQPLVVRQITRISKTQMNLSCLSRHDLNLRFLINPSIIVKSVDRTALERLDHMGHILKTIVLRVFLNHEHVVIDKTELTHITHMNNACALLPLERIENTEKVFRCEILHLKIFSDNEDIFSEDSDPIIAVGLLRERVVSLLICPVIQIRVQTAIIILNRKHQHNIDRQHRQIRKSLKPDSFFCHSFRQHTVNPRHKQERRRIGNIDPSHLHADRHT